MLWMLTIPERLRTAREAKSLSIQQVAEITKIRADHIIALEEGNYGVFSAPVYVRGFVRSYSSLLKLDVPEMMALLDAELRKGGKLLEPTPPAQESGKWLDRLMLVIARIDWRRSGLAIAGITVVLLTVLVYSIVQHYKRRDPLSHLQPVLYQAPTQKVSGEVLALPNAPGQKK